MVCDDHGNYFARAFVQLDGWWGCQSVINEACLVVWQRDWKMDYVNLERTRKLGHLCDGEK